MMAKSTINFIVNGSKCECDLPSGTPLLYYLRNDLELNGPKFGCGLGQCGACTILVNGVATRSCITLVEDVSDAEVITLDGLGSREDPHPLQSAFIDQQAAQCGYCMNGMIMTAVGFLAKNSTPTEGEIKEAVSANLCRCGTHQRIIAAIKQGAKGMANES